MKMFENILVDKKLFIELVERLAVYREGEAGAGTSTRQGFTDRRNREKNRVVVHHELQSGYAQ
jgi:hypothetical protein